MTNLPGRWTAPPTGNGPWLVRDGAAEGAAAALGYGEEVVPAPAEEDALEPPERGDLDLRIVARRAVSGGGGGGGGVCVGDVICVPNGSRRGRWREQARANVMIPVF